MEQIIAVDVAIVTHMHHFDHFDDFAAKALPKDMPIFVQSEKEASDMRNPGFKEVTALTEESVEFKDVSLYRTEALHGDGVTADYYYRKLGVPAEACGGVLKAQGEKVFHLAGDTLWFDGIVRAIERHNPEVIALNAANARMYDGTPILMGIDGVREVVSAAFDALIIATHMDAANHARVSRKDLRQFSKAEGLEERLLIPEDGETIDIP